MLSYLSELSIFTFTGAKWGGLIYSGRRPPRMTVSCLAAATEKEKSKSSLCVSSHTRRRRQLSGAENFPVSVFICR